MGAAALAAPAIEAEGASACWVVPEPEREGVGAVIEVGIEAEADIEDVAVVV